MKINKVLGTDDLLAYILKEQAEEITPLLRAVYTQSLQDSSLPRDWVI